MGIAIFIIFAVFLFVLLYAVYKATSRIMKNPASPSDSGARQHESSSSTSVSDNSTTHDCVGGHSADSGGCDGGGDGGGGD